MNAFLARVQGKLIISCQAQPGEPLHGSAHMAAMARAAAEAGAGAIRAESPADIAAIRAAVDLPILGLYKKKIFEGNWCRITPTFESAREVVAAGADAIATEATGAPRPDGQPLTQFLTLCMLDLDRPVIADVSTLEEGLMAAEQGAVAVATTMAGYTLQSGGPRTTPDFDLLEALVRQCPVPVILEGHVWEPAQVTEGFRRGAHAVVVGSAITRPQLIARRFVDAVPARGA